MVHANGISMCVYIRVYMFYCTYVHICACRSKPYAIRGYEFLLKSDLILCLCSTYDTILSKQGHLMGMQIRTACLPLSATGSRLPSVISWNRQNSGFEYKDIRVHV